MLKHSLKPLTPLGNDEPMVISIGGTKIVEQADLVFASLTLREGKSRAFTAAAKRTFKTELPDPGQSVSKGDYTVFWSSFDQWFVEAPTATHEDIASLLKTEFEESASITEQSGGWCRFDLDGDASVSILERLCAVNTAMMDTDAATRSVIEHIGVFVLCRTIRAHFSIYGPRSSAGSLHHALVSAAKSAT